MKNSHGNGILVGIIAGILLGGAVVALGAGALGESLFGSLVAIGEVLGRFFLLALRMIIVPLVLASVIMGITRLGDVRRIGRVGARTIGYYALTTGLAVALGVVLVLVIQPGAGMGEVLAGEPRDEAAMENIREKEAIGPADLILSFLHPNIMGALADGDILPIIVFALILGGILTTMGEKARPVLSFIEGIDIAMMKFVGLIMWIAPAGIFGLVVWKFGEATLQPGGLRAMLSGLGMYSMTVLIGLGIHGFLTLFVLCVLLGRRRPVRFFLQMSPAVLTAWSTASSSATLPVTIDCAIERAGVDAKAAGFVLPLGATINMDGTALYEAVAAIFIAQALGIDLSFGQLLLVFVTATIASIGAAGIPQAGLVTMIIVLNAVKLPVEGIGMILAVDWLLDRFRTAINVWGDSVGAAFIHRATAE